MDLLPWLLGFVVKYPKITVSAACFLLLFCRLRRTRKRPDRLPTNWPVVGALPAIVVNAGRVYEWVTEFLRAAGMSYVVEGPWGSPGDVLVTADPTNVMPVHGEELAATIARIDANGDGCVDMDEFTELYESVMRVGDAEEASMREAFDVFDRNGDGFITVDELGAMLASLGIKQGRTPEDYGHMIGQVDRDGDGRVDFLEFKQMMRGGAFATVR